MRVARGEDRLGLLQREVGDDQAADAALGELAAKRSGPRARIGFT